MSEIVNTALAAFERVLDRRVLAALEVCARCGICADSCHVFASTGEFQDTPTARSEAVRRFYRRRHDPLGQIFPWWVRAKDATEEDLDALTEAAFATCTLCQRCAMNCPLGVDTALIMKAARAMLTAVGKAPEMLVQLADAAIVRGENPDLFREVYKEIVADLEQQAQERLGDPTVRIPMDKQGADILYVALSGAHTILPAAIIFHVAGADWTLSAFEASNYGVFLGNPEKAQAIAQRIVGESGAGYLPRLLQPGPQRRAAGGTAHRPAGRGAEFPRDDTEPGGGLLLRRRRRAGGHPGVGGETAARRGGESGADPRLRGAAGSAF